MAKLTFTNLDDYRNLGKAVKISGKLHEIVVTLDLGPRIIKFNVPDGKNMFGDEVPITEKVFDKDIWKIYGGHRIWHSPEAYPRSYVPDNIPVEKYELFDDGIILYQKQESWTHIQKIMEIRFADDHIKVFNRIVNNGAWPIKTAVWSLTIGSKGGRQVLPVVQRNTGLLANRHIVMWPNCPMNDDKLYWGKKFIVVENKIDSKVDIKIGYPNEYGWAAYFNNGCCFIKKFNHIKNAEYPDFGCSWETYTSNWGVELESLSPLTLIKPGETLTHEDEWYLIDNIRKPDVNEEEIEAVMRPLAEKACLEMPVEDLRHWREIPQEY
jgi:hypothetical protein